MYNKIVKTIDEHNIDRDANVMFAFDLDGSDYVSYRISRDEEQDNLFVSKIIRNIDNTFNMVDIEDAEQKALLSEIVMVLVKKAVNDSADTLAGDSVTLSNNKTVKFINVNFNREQRINVRKTYVTTVKKEVTMVTEKYYVVEVHVEETKAVEDIFPTVTPTVSQVTEELREALPEVPPTVEAPVLSTPTVSIPKENSADGFVTFGAESTIPEPKVEPSIIPFATQDVSQTKVPVNETVVPTPFVNQPVPSIVEPITVAEPAVSVVNTDPILPPVATEKSELGSDEPVVAIPTPVIPTPVVNSASVPVPDNDVSQPLMFDASKETNLNAALGEVANATAISVENIEPVREFGVDAPLQQSVVNQSTVTPMVQPEVASVPKKLTKKAGFANSKFFMVVAIAFFLASCIFLGYEVFNYFQLTK